MARTTDNEHSGHRERMRKKFIENGFDVFETHEALEMFLYYAIPRKDTNPLAHRLLDRYITVGGVCDAPIDELMKEFGLSENAAALLKMLPEMARLYTESKMSHDNIIDYENLGKIFNRIFRKELFELTAKLSRKSFIVCKHKCRSLNPLNNICHCKSFTRTRYTEKSLFTVACIYTVYKFFDCLRLVACRLIF